MEFLKKAGPGVLLCLVLAIPSWLLGRAFPVIGGPVIAILLGMVVSLVLKDRTRYQSGIAFTSKKILQYAVILLGFGLNLSEIAKVGAQSLPIICTTITMSLVIAFLLRKWMKIPGNISVLVGVDSSICGGSAIAATAPVIGADDEEIAQAISVIFLFNILAALFFPTLGGAMGMSNEGFGLFAGTAINDTSSVTAAASTWDTLHGTNGAVLEYATIVKLTRTLAIIPITWFWRSGGLTRPSGAAAPPAAPLISRRSSPSSSSSLSWPPSSPRFPPWRVWTPACSSHSRSCPNFSSSWPWRLLVSIRISSSW
jgi:uncharacterized integral membrane protein (TIGR00698 family)